MNLLLVRISFVFVRLSTKFLNSKKIELKIYFFTPGLVWCKITVFIHSHVVR